MASTRVIILLPAIMLDAQVTDMTPIVRHASQPKMSSQIRA